MSSLPPGTDLCTIPAAQPPPGRTSNFVNPPNLAAETIAVTTVTLAWATLFTTARLYTNFRKLTWADGFVVIALALSATYSGLVLDMLKYTRHQWDVPILYAQGTLLGPVIFFAKSSIFLLCRQIFTIQKAMKYAIRFGLLFTFLLYWPGVGLESYFAAPHIGETWDDLLVNKRPEKLIYWGIVQGALSVVLDIYIFILPLPLLSKLQLPRKKRWQLLIIFSTAMMGIVASVIALVFRIQLLTTSDTTFTQSALFICVTVENNVAIIVSSMPFFAAFFRSHVLESALLKTLRSRLSSSGGHSVVGTVDHHMVKAPPSPSHLLNDTTGHYHELRDFDYATNTKIQAGGGGERLPTQGNGISREVNIEQEIREYSIV
ncbi:NADPH-dependent 1-acyldihydroxyacetone phosphate reductase [Aspergillus lentulus]|nr:NADPH-dependent 1-acyldihydroxyacetone phosphate reductase [Aspergillus lentulus]GFF66992.1 NADPH-dependent 1-acyldihydroxyacetone phosphate reductase [Aspergillus lentulus]